MGEGTFRHLQEQSTPLNSVTAFCFTHHHRDHNADAMSVLPTAWSRGNAAPILGPEGTKELVDFLWTFYAEDLEYRSGGRRRNAPNFPSRPLVHELPLEEPLEVGGVRIRTAEVPHTITTFAYRFDVGEESIVISGDLSYSEELIELATGADILVIDSGGIVYKGDGPYPDRSGQGHRRKEGAKPRAHASLEEVARMAVGAGVKKLVLTHFRPGAVDETETRRRMSEFYPGEIVFAEDLQLHRIER